MPADETIVADIFEGMCYARLSGGETRLLKMLCGLDSNDAPLSVAQIAVITNRTPGDVRRILARTLLKLPESSLKPLRDYLSDEQHPYHRSLKRGQRIKLQQMVEYALVLQRIRAQGAKSQPPPAPQVMRPTPLPLPVAQPVERPVSRAQIITAVLDTIGRPAHYLNIHARAVEQHRIAFNEAATYQTMTQNREFVTIGEGMFALARWRNRVPGDGEPRLRYCPPLPVAAKARAETLFELMLRVREWSASRLTYRDVHLQTERFVRSVCPPQDLFDLLYAAGVIPLIDYLRQRDYVVHTVLAPELDAASARKACLDALVRRIANMPELLQGLADAHRPTSARLAEFVYGDARDSAEIGYRLRLLESVGAARQGGKGTWTLAPAGFAALQAHPPADIQAPAPVPVSIDADTTWDDFELLDL